MVSLGSVVPGFDTSKYAHPLISERAIDEARPLKVIYIGAGISGIDAAIQFPKYVPNIELAIYEKNPEVGGTWYENRYPGCACDIPAHSYQLSYESNTEWSQFYATAQEILDYTRKVADKYNVRRFMKFHHRCIEAKWNGDTAKWHVKFERLDTGEIIEDVGDVFMTGIGSLNQWAWPDIKGLGNYKGALLHSANWDETFDAANKNIAVIGAGSSGIQIVPALQGKVNKLDHYVRGRTWIASTFGSDVVRERTGGDGNFSYTEAEKEHFRKNPADYIKYRKALEAGMQGTYAIAYKGSKEQVDGRAAFTEDMTRRLKKKPEVAQHMLPDFPPLCKRLTPGPGYLEALTADNVEVIPTVIDHVDATGITTADGKHRAVDAIVCATGFNTTSQNRIPIFGRNGTDLRERNRKRAETYLGLAVDEFPNFFQSLGPNSAVGNGSLLIVIEATHRYVGQILQRLSTGNAKTVEPKRKSVENFSNFCDAYFERTVYSAECGSWYKSSPPGSDPEAKKNGRVTALWPGSSMHAFKTLHQVRFDDFEIEPLDGNDFGWIGDGWTVAELTKDPEGLSYYINDTKFLHHALEESGDVVESTKKVNGLKRATADVSYDIPQAKRLAVDPDQIPKTIIAT